MLFVLRAKLIRKGYCCTQNRFVETQTHSKCDFDAYFEDA